MSVSIFDENTPQDGLEFTPYNETPVKAVPVITASMSGTMNTREIDPFRQGVEISSEAFRFKGLGAKIWAGNIKGYTVIRTLGQALSFTEYKNDKKFNDLLVKFNPVSYIELGENYPYPLIFNEGPQQNKETSIQPFTIPFRNGRDTNESQDVAHQVRGALEDGNQNNLQLNGYTDRITQFVQFYNASEEHSPFLDEGSSEFGQTSSGSIKIFGYINSAEINSVPFDDQLEHKLINQLTNKGLGDTDSYVYGVDSNLDEDQLSLDPTFYLFPSQYSSSYFIDDANNRILGRPPGTILPTFYSGSGFISGSGATLPSYRNILAFGGNTFLTAAVDPTLQLTGSMSVTFLFRPFLSMPYEKKVLSCNSGTLVDDTDHQTLYEIKLISGSTHSVVFSWTTGGVFVDNIIEQPSIWNRKPEWNHFAFTRDEGGGCIFYCNGQNLGSSGIALPDGPGLYQKLSIGGPETSPGIWNATQSLGGLAVASSSYLAELKIFDYALSESEVFVTLTQSMDFLTRSNAHAFELQRVLQVSSSQFDLDEDLRENYNQKSATAGKDVYGPGQGRTGTDSITFNGWMRGC